LLLLIVFFSDPSTEKRSSDIYVPRDDAFSDEKQSQFTMSTISTGVSAVLESLDAILTDQDLGFKSFEEIDTIYKEGFHLPKLKDNGLNFLQSIIPRLIKVANDSQNILRFDTPETFKSKNIHNCLFLNFIMLENCSLHYLLYILLESSKV